MPEPSVPRVPPRFVPTLTEVVQDAAAERAGPSPSSLSPSPSPSTGSMAGLHAPSAVSRPAVPGAAALRPDAPTPRAHSSAPSKGSATQVPPPEPVHSVLSKDFEELLVHRVMQRVDVSLDIRLRGAIAAVVEEQTRSIVPRLREEIEAVVRQAVYEAVADELAAGVGTPPA